MGLRRRLGRWRLSAADWYYELRRRTHTGRLTQGRMGLRRRLGRWRLSAADWYYERKSAQTFILGAVMVVSVSIGVVVLVTTPSSTPTPPPANISDSPEEPEQQQPVRFMNHAGGYVFEYPDAWQLTHEGDLSNLESPTGRIAMAFGVSPAGRLELVSTRLLRSQFGPTGEGKLIGTKRQRIAGAPAVLQSGLTRDGTGVLIRYLAIAIDGDSREYTILITVSGRSDPARVLRTVEEIVASFETSKVSSF
jgi:hypothetical protein